MRQRRRLLRAVSEASRRVSERGIIVYLRPPLIIPCETRPGSRRARLPRGGSVCGRSGGGLCNQRGGVFGGAAQHAAPRPVAARCGGCGRRAAHGARARRAVSHIVRVAARCGCGGVRAEQLSSVELRRVRRRAYTVAAFCRRGDDRRRRVAAAARGGGFFSEARVCRPSDDPAFSWSSFLH